MTRRNTRELILGTSLALFNRFGEQEVTTNHIADEADISPGNLYYHFRHKQDIIVELFKRFAVELDPVIDVPDVPSLDAEDLWFQLHVLFDIKGRFRFFYRNLVDITAHDAGLARAFRALLYREREAFSAIVAGLERNRALSITDTERLLLLDNMMRVTTYWIPYAELFGAGSLEDGTAQTRSIAGILQLVMPYLRRPESQAFGTLVREYLADSR